MNSIHPHLGVVMLHTDTTYCTAHDPRQTQVTRERFLQRICQNPPNLQKILSRDGVFNEIVIARHAQLKVMVT